MLDILKYQTPGELTHTPHAEQILSAERPREARESRPLPPLDPLPAQGDVPHCPCSKHHLFHSSDTGRSEGANFSKKMPSSVFEKYK